MSEIEIRKMNVHVIWSAEIILLRPHMTTWRSEETNLD